MFGNLAQSIEKAKQALETGEFYDEDDPRRNYGIHYKCDECSGYGYVRTRSGVRYCKTCVNRVIASEVDDWHRGKWDNWGITFKDIESFPKFQPNEVYTACKSFLDDFGLPDPRPRALLLLGGNGRGKTACPLAMIKELSKKGMRGIAIDFPTMIKEMKHGLDGNNYIDQIFNRIEQSTLVFVDEVGKENKGGNINHPFEALRAILNNCYRRKYLIISSNLPMTHETDMTFINYIPYDILSRLKISCEGFEFRYTKEAVEVPFNQDLR